MKRQRSGHSSTRHTASWWVVLASGVLIVLFAIAMVRETVKSQQVRRQIKTLRQAVAAEEERHERLDELIAYLSSPTFQEREARLKLGLKKPGERVYVVPPGAINSSGGILDGEQTASAGAADSQSIPQRWWRYFFPPDDLHKTSSSS